MAHYHSAPRPNSNSLLELEAADYFELDKAQMRQIVTEATSKHQAMAQMVSTSRAHTRALRQPASCRKAAAAKSKRRCIKPTIVDASDKAPSRRPTYKHKNKRHSSSSGTKRQDAQTLSNRFVDRLDSSSSASTNSLPSISSSPSVSPSLVCPHLSLDDILNLRNLGEHRSAHTLGLCARCLRAPPAHMQSPLSPVFKPSIAVDKQATNSTLASAKVRQQQQQQQQQQSAKRQESLDCALSAKDLQRMQLSPTMRNSVEFIRNNSVEAGRVIKVYRNGQPYDKPLRVCIMRDEFASLNHLLDHINSRQLIPSGARYLFHVDGQLVYSTHELKHAHAYIVSGTRQLDARAAALIKKTSHENTSRERLNASSEMLHVASASERRKQPKHYELATSAYNLRATQRNARPQQQNALRRVVSEPKLAQHRAPSPKPRASALKSAARPSRPMTSVARSSTAAAATQTKPRAATAKPSATKPKQLPSASGAPRKPLMSKHSSQSLDGGLNVAEQIVTDQHQQQLQSAQKLSRAKSELSAIPGKRKKNVTFQDMGPDSSNAPRAHSSPVGRSATDKSATPVVQTAQVATPQTINFDTSDIGIQVSDSVEGFLIDLPVAMPPKGDEARSSGRRTVHRAAPAKKRQIVTITERQLSSDELNKFRDLDHGDHHSKATQSALQSDSPEKVKDDGDDDVGQEQIVAVGEEKQQQQQQQQQQQRQDEAGTQTQQADAQWHYPGGRSDAGRSVTPVERPVSQSGASEAVQARVTTPTPSLSTAGGDSNSLSMSYESASVRASGRSAATKSPTMGPPPPTLTDREHAPIVGELRRGIDPPEHNLRLAWVNGFAINDRYPENSATRVGLGTNSGRSSPTAPLLSPKAPATSGQPVFRPNERFHNWVCHCRKLDELMYPVGKLVVLWSRWTNEQRYYARHTGNVSALTLAPLDADLAASAQTEVPGERASACIHLWAPSSLNTLHVLEVDAFRGKRIYSLKVVSVRNTDQCELLAGALDDRRLWLYSVHTRKTSQEPQSPRRSALRATSRERQAASSAQLVMSADKPLQSNQSPLLVTNLSSVMLSFGRRHLQLYAADPKRQRLRPLHTEIMGAEFTPLISRATCLARLSPGELLVGDSDGNVYLLLVGQMQSAASATSAANAKLEYAQKFSIEPIALLRSPPPPPPQNNGDSSANKRLSITCVSRVSGNLFATGDATCSVRFWRIERSRSPATKQRNKSVSCRQLTCLSLPRDLGYVCSIVLANYNRRKQIVEFYVVSTSNAVLFGSVQLEPVDGDTILAHSSLSVVYEGHEAAVVGLVADTKPDDDERPNESRTFFTCSLDCKICKWSGRSLVWKSLLPSACASLCVHPVGDVLAVGSADGTVYVLDKMSGLLMSYFALTPVCINCVAYSLDGSLLAAGCANGSIFILPVHERGLKYQKVSIFQSPYPVVSLQFSLDNQYILTSVTHAQYQELILWDLPNFRYMRDNVKLAADRIGWFDSICSGSEDVRAIWENANIAAAAAATGADSDTRRHSTVRAASARDHNSSTTTHLDVVNLSCHRCVQSGAESLCAASDTRGFVRLFKYPAYDTRQGFYEVRTSTSPVNCCRFLKSTRDDKRALVSSSLDGSICLWHLRPV